MPNPSLSTVDPVAIVIARIKANTALLAELGVNETAVSGLNEPPYPHFQITPGGLGEDGRLRHKVTAEVNIFVWGDLAGAPGSARLREVLYLAVEDIARMGDEIEPPGSVVVTDVQAVGTGRWAPDRATGQPCWAHSLSITAHPAYV